MRGERLDGKAILKALKPVGLFSCAAYESIDSTSSEVRRRLLDGDAAPLLVLSEGQTAGRGRMGKSFYSPRGTGLYMSLGFPLDMREDTVGITSAAAVAVMRAVRSVCGIQTEIKWVNDIYIDGRKVCGILAESLTVCERRLCVIGVGINLCTEDFPRELCATAGSLNVGAEQKNALAIAVCKEILTLVSALPDRSFMDEYRKFSCVLGKEVEFTRNGEGLVGRAESIDDGGALCVRLSDGELRALSSGEISLRTI